MLFFYSASGLLDFYFRCDRFGLVDSIVQLLSSYRIFDSICFTIYFAICFTICFIDCFTYCVADCLTFWSSFCFTFTTLSFTFTTLSCKCGIQLVKKGSEQSLRVTTGARRVLSQRTISPTRKLLETSRTGQKMYKGGFFVTSCISHGALYTLCWNLNFILLWKRILRRSASYLFSIEMSTLLLSSVLVSMCVQVHIKRHL